MITPKTSGLTLGELTFALRDFDPVLSGEPTVNVLDVDQDSRSVGPGALFVARPGMKSDGLRYLEDAVRRGAAAVMVSAEANVPALECPVLRVSDVTRAVSFAAEAVHGHPSQALALAGVTGTNGKTTTSWLIQRTLEKLGLRCGRLGTLGFEISGHTEETHLTTPEADGVSRSLAIMRRLGATHGVMEVSSVALSSGRVEALKFDVAAFSNLTHDHLDFHGTFEAYRDAKARLFQALTPRAAVLNVDDDFGRWLSTHTRARVITVGMAGECDVSGRGLTAAAGGVSGTLEVFGRALEVRTRLVGRHNAENLMLAFGVMAAFDVDLEVAAAGVAEIDQVPGRLERCDGPGDDCVVLVDYAHTPDALERVLSAIDAGASGRIICVFGCGGERDPAKRFPMGKAVGEGAQLAILTNDNPRGESPEAIASAVELGLRAATADYEVCLDRAQAIERAISLAAPGDVVLIAGKGHETYQLIGASTFAFDDREQARLALLRRRARRQGHAEP